MENDISETAFASQVEDLLDIGQWRWTHFRPAYTNKGWRTPLSGDKGLPDYICVRPPRLIFAELKDQYTKTTPEQEGWLEDLRECVRFIPFEPIQIGEHGLERPTGEILLVPSLEVYLWRPKDIDEISGILR